MKFIAILLAALSLFAAVGSAVCVIGLASYDLYDNSVEELYEEQMSSTRRNFAVNLAHRYASTHLGNCPESFLDEYYGGEWQFNTFTWGYFFYTIKNEKGEVVETTVEGDLAGAAHYSILVTDIRYRSIFYGPVPQNSAGGQKESSRTETADRSPVPETEGTMSTEEAAASSVETDAETAETATEPLEIYQSGYYDSEAGSYVDIAYQIMELPPYTVELYLLPGAMAEEPLWTMLKEIWAFRYELFWAMGAGLLLFAVFMVYLCCAAGRKPGSDKIAPVAFNRIPLDLYCAIAFGGGLILVVLGVNLLRLLDDNSPIAAIILFAFSCFLCCLLPVGFFFAFAAQVKAGKGFWWRRSVIGWCLRKLAAGARFLARGIRAVMTALPVIWQWLLTAFMMVLVTALSFLLWFTSHNGLAEFFFMCSSLTCLAVCVAIVCYGGWCMATLIRGARFMAQGNLGYQIPTTYLLGPFRDCAQQLNSLAGAASVAAERQLRSERMKTELITNVSHDIKTPLTSIINYVDLMKKPHTEEDHRQYLDVLDRQSQRLKKLVDDLMEMSKASTGNMTVEITRINAGESVNQALGEFADKLERSELVPVFRSPENPVFMKADGRLVWRVMSNILSNASKYALPGTRLYIDMMELEGSVVISFKNISREELNISGEDLMERFVRGDASRNTEGSGLGLNIAKSLMELQRGRLQVLVDGDLFKVTLIFPSDK